MIDQTDPKGRWYLERHGKFTASMVYKIIPNGATNIFAPAGWNYIQDRAIETMTALYEAPEMEFVEALVHGKAYEENAYFEYLRVSKNHSMRHFGGENPIYLEYNSYSGGSPDGLMGSGTDVNWLLEIKCPKNSKNHFKYMKMQSQWDLKELKPEYYAQIQFLLMITKAEGAHFASYDERFKEESKRLKILEVKPDKKFADTLEVKLQMAQKEKLKIIAAF
jgi:hypothetical protein